MPLCAPLAYCGCGAGIAALLALEEKKSGRNSAARAAAGAGGPEEECAALNGLIRTLWPRIKAFIQLTVQETIVPAVDQALPKALRGWARIERLSLGECTPKLGDARIEVRGDQAILLNLQVDIAADLDVKLLAGSLSIGVHAFSFRGVLTACLRPATAQPPFFGALEVYFVNPPELQVDFFGATSAPEWPLVRGAIRDTIMANIADVVVLPARVVVDMRPAGEGDAEDGISLRYPEPIGVLRLLLKSGRDLRGRGGRACDAYVTAALGQQRWRSQTVKSSASPDWAHGNIVDFLVYDPGQRIELRALDEGALSTDGFLLGEAQGVVVERFISASAPVNECLPLSGEKGERVGSLTIATRWFHLSASVPVQGISQAVARGPTQLVLKARLEDAWGLPEDARSPFTVHISVNARDQVYLATSAQSTDAAARRHISHNDCQPLRNVCLNLARENLRVDEISSLVGLSVRHVETLIDQARDPALLQDLAREAATVHPSFRQILRVPLPWTPDVFSDEVYVGLEVLDRDGLRVGEQFRARVDQVARKGVSGPFQILPGAALQGKLSVSWLQVPTISA